MIGITFEEKVLEKLSLKEYLNIIEQLNIDFLELAPDFNAYTFEFYKHISLWCQEKNIQVHFHHPHFINDDFRLENFNIKNTQKIKNYLNAIDKLIASFEAHYIIHGATINNSRIKAYNMTQSFINFFIMEKERNQWSLTLSIETLNKHSKKAIGDHRKEILNLIEQYPSNHIGICLDITHDYRNYKAYQWPHNNFMKRVNHFHIHGFNDQGDHIGLANNPELLSLIKNINKKKPLINYELLFTDDYIKILKNDIKRLKDQLTLKER